MNDDSAPTVSVTATDAAGAEPGQNPIQFTVTRSANLVGTSAVDLAWGGIAVLGVDYVVSAAAGGTLSADGKTLTLTAGVATATLTVTPVDDAVVEGAESVSVTLNGGTGYAVGTPASASGSIADDDTGTVIPQLSVADRIVTEADKATTTVEVTITLSAPATGTVSVTASTATGTALPVGDFVSATATITFSSGETSKTFRVKIVNDRKAEQTEWFAVVLSNAVGALIADGTGVVTIIDNDSALVATHAAPGSATASSLAAVQISGAFPGARALWAAAGFETSRPETVTVELVDLPGATLAEADGDAIRLDVDAAGWSWTEVGGRVDLTTVLAHEVGHLLGLDHDAAALYAIMAPTLAPADMAATQIAGAPPPEPGLIRSPRGGWLRLGNRGWLDDRPPALGTEAVGLETNRAGARLSVAERIADQPRGKAPRAAFDGKGYCWVELGDGRAAFAGGDFYTEPEPRLKMRRPGGRSTGARSPSRSGGSTTGSRQSADTSPSRSHPPTPGRAEMRHDEAR